MTFEEKMNALSNALFDVCNENNICYTCCFCDEEEVSTDQYTCGIRDHNGKIPYDDDWDMKVALGFEQPYKSVFPEEVENSMMQHFTRVE